MLGQRLFSAAIIISTMLVLVWLDYQMGRSDWLGRPGLMLVGLSLIVTGLAAGELMHMWTTERRKLNSGLAVIASLVMTAVASAPAFWIDYPADCPIGKFGWSISGMVIALVIVFFYEMYFFDRSPEKVDDEPGVVTERLAHYALCFGYLLMLFGFLASHRMIDGSNEIGMFSIIMLIATVKMSDSFAYFAGKAIGKNKIAPLLSPKKTFEGAIGSFFGAWFAGAIMVYVIAPYVFKLTGDTALDKSFGWLLAYGALTTLAGMAGDLAESLLKRDANCKDSSKWLPGLGGVLDVMDSLVFAAPVSYFLWIV